MVEKYVYSVTHKLPEKQRKKAEDELRGLIEEKLKARGKTRIRSQQDIEAVLMEPGDPECIAVKYKGNRSYIIGPELFDTYWQVLKIVFLAVLIGLSVMLAIDLTVSPVSILERFTDFFFSLITWGVQVYGWVTLVFVILNYAGVTVSQFGKRKNNQENWTPASLHSIPHPLRRVRPFEPVGFIVFSVLLMVVFIFSRDQIGLHIVNSEQSRTIIPIFYEEGIRVILPYLYALFVLSVLKEFIKYISREWSIKLFVYMVIFNVVLYLFWAEILKDPAIWNQEFINSLVQYGILILNDEFYNTVTSIWNEVTGRLIIYLGGAFIIDTMVMLLRIVVVKKPIKEQEKVEM